MSQTVAHLDEMTQSNAALAEESAASANALASRIAQLNGLVSGYRTILPPPAATGERTGSVNWRKPRSPKPRPTVTPQRNIASRPPLQKVANARTGNGWDEF